MKHKFMIKIGVLGAAICMLSSIAAVAKAQPYLTYSGTIQPMKNNAVLGSAYRSTANSNRPWAVIMDKSTESGDKKTVFWLETSSGLNVSPDLLVIAGQGEFQGVAKSGASATHVRLTAEDNNYKLSSYYIEGSWAEE